MKNTKGIWLPEADTHFAYMMGKEPLRPYRGQLVGVYQHFKIAQVLEQVSNFGVAVDIGAHVGFWSMWLAEQFEHVHAFEPMQEHADCFERNVCMANVTLHRMALGDSGGHVRMESGNENSGKTHIDGYGDIPICKLDDFSLCDVGLIKIDTEGYESAVLHGAADTIQRNKPLIVIEVNKNKDRYAKESPEHLLAKIRYSMLLELGSDRLYHAN